MATSHPNAPKQAQFHAGPRLLKLGESIEFRLGVPVAGSAAGEVAAELAIFPRYLRHARPGARFQTDAGLDWLAELQPEHLRIRLRHGQGQACYCPTQAGNYLVRWQVGTDYGLALWNVPGFTGTEAPVIESNAEEVVVARSPDDETHLVLLFALRPDLELYVTVRPQAPL